MSETTPPARVRCIVAATDFSLESERALAWAVHLAVQRRAELKLIHAVPLGEAMEVPSIHGTSLAEELLAAARVRLAATASSLREKVRSVTWNVALGPPAHVIVQEAEVCRAELLVLGTRGLRGWQHLMLGSTAERAIATAPCPVLAVHEHDPLPPPRPWRLLAASDGSAEAGRAVRAAARLLLPAQTVLLRAFEPPPVFYSGAGEVSTYAIVEAARKAASEELQLEARALAIEGIEVLPLLRDGFAPDVIVTAAAELQADAVVVGTHGRSGLAQLMLGSNAERVAQRASVPVLAVPRRAAVPLEEAQAALVAGGVPAGERS